MPNSWKKNCKICISRPQRMGGSSKRARPPEDSPRNNVEKEKRSYPPSRGCRIRHGRSVLCAEPLWEVENENNDDDIDDNMDLCDSHTVICGTNGRAPSLVDYFATNDLRRLQLLTYPTEILTVVNSSYPSDGGDDELLFEDWCIV